MPSLRLCRRHHSGQRAGDEPLIPPAIIRQVADNLAAATAPMATLSVPIQDAEEVFNPNAVKVVTDQEGYALYFSRASIPWDRDRFAANREQIGDHYQRHIGIYAYRAGFIQRYVDWAPSLLEQIEALEQLRVLWYGRRSTWPRRSRRRRSGWIPRPIWTRCARCWRTDADNSKMTLNGACGRRFCV